jgi:hypothetical protein
VHQSLDPLRDNNNGGILTAPKTLVNSIAQFLRKITIICVGAKIAALALGSSFARHRVVAGLTAGL